MENTDMRRILLGTALFFASHAIHASLHESSMGGENPLVSGLTKTEKIRIAKASAPANVSENALILDADRSVLQEGGNGWTCMVGTPPSYGNPMCMDEIWVAYFDAFYAKAPYSPPAGAIGFSYMLVGDLPMDNDDPFNLDESKNTWVQEGPHLMMLVPQTMFGNLPTSPYQGGPYVMWQGTEYAHIMVPLEKTEPIIYAQ